MSDLFKRIVSPFVEFKEEEAPTTEEVPAPSEAAPASLVTAEELAADPDVQRVQQAVGLLAELPLAEIPPEKARNLIVATLKFAGMQVDELLGSFERVRGLYSASMETERQAIAERQRQHEEMVEKLKTALAMEQEQFAAEVAERNKRIEGAVGDLAKIDQAMVFFQSKE